MQLFDKRSGDIVPTPNPPLDRVLEYAISGEYIIISSNSHPENEVTNSVTCWSIPKDDLVWSSSSERGVGQLVTTPKFIICILSSPTDGMKLRCINISSGEIFWEDNVNEVSSLAAGGDYLYSISDNSLSIYGIESGDKLQETGKVAGDSVIPTESGILVVTHDSRLSYYID